MKKSILISLFVILVAGLGLYFISNKKVDTKPSDYKEVSYTINNKDVTLNINDSKIEQVPRVESENTTRFFGNEVRGDFNNDGMNDVAFLVTENGGGSGTFFYLVAALKTKDGYAATNPILIGDRIAPQTTEFHDGKIIVNYADRNPGEPMTTRPSLGVSKYISVEGQTLKESIINNTEQKNMHATLHTTLGDITIEFLPNLAPKTVENFLKLAGEGYYDGIKFHRVIKDFMIQGGDPLTKDDSKMASWGTGGPGYKFADEITPESKNVLGTVSMANAGPNTNGSQFFINAKDNSFLNGGYTVFGKVVDGLDVALAINSVTTDANDRPLTPVVIKSITIK